jgi:ABC-type glutathione transport system ATPase component
MTTPAAPVLELCNVSKAFQRRGSDPVTAAQSVDLYVGRSETVALVGESGSGKSTLSRIALGLIRPDTGVVKLFGRTISDLPLGALRKVRTAMQPVFQDASAAFNPRRPLRQLMVQAVAMSGIGRRDVERRTVELLEQVGLKPGTDYLDRFPHELSGGQRQRLAIARALAMDPAIIIADEPLSGADVSIRSQLLNLLIEMREARQLAYLFITHDISVARAFADRVAVMYKGAIVETGPAGTVLAEPQHPYTQRLLAASRPFLPADVAPKPWIAADAMLRPGTAARW